jgi:hypothetical protein
MSFNDFCPDGTLQQPKSMETQLSEGKRQQLLEFVKSRFHESNAVLGILDGGIVAPVH